MAARLLPVSAVVSKGANAIMKSRTWVETVPIGVSALVLLWILSVILAFRESRPQPPVLAAAGPRGILLTVLRWTTPHGRPLQAEIAVMNPDGRGRRTITHTPAFEFDPVWSPDGRSIAFAAMTDPRRRSTDIFVMGLDGTGRRALTRTAPGELVYSPSWSPDGQTVAFCKEPWDINEDVRSMWEAWAVAVDGSSLRRIGEGIPLGWSNDGRRMMVRIPGRGLCITDASGSLVKVIEEDASEGAWSPDGNSIAYAASLGRTRSGGKDLTGLYIANRSGSRPRLVTRHQSFSGLLFGLHWAWDSQAVVYSLLERQTDGYPEEWSIYITEVGTGRTRKLLGDDITYSTLGRGTGAFTVRLLRPLTEHPRPIDEALLKALPLVSDHPPESAKVRRLLAQGADPNARSTYYDTTALFHAWYSGDKASIKALLEYGADPNATSMATNGLSLLASTIGKGDIALARQLLAHGARVNRTCWEMAGASGNSEVRTLLGPPGKAERDAMLVGAASAGNTTRVRELLGQSADPNAPTGGHDTALIGAVKSESTETVRLLLEHGANVNALSDGSPLLWPSAAGVLRRYHYYSRTAQT
jgi:hypothetical protein